jgi:polyferredoxin
MVKTLKKYGTVPIITSLLTVFIITMARLKGPEGILLLDRFIPGLGWFQIAASAVYAGLISDHLLNHHQINKIRIGIWSLFLIVFFLQFIAGLFISDIFLMTGKLHIPVPAVILGGPIYRGQGFFMPVLYISTLVLAGPAWCSYLCYFGAIDGFISSKKKKPSFPKESWKYLRYFTVLLIVVSAFILRIFEIKAMAAIIGACLFGTLGILISIFISHKRGIMGHCSYYCPIGLISNITGKISPFRIKIEKSCNNCMICIPVCRYNALSTDNIRSGNPGLSCTLCGDCIDSCISHSINYKYFGLSPEKSRILFTVIITVLHASFLTIARI